MALAGANKKHSRPAAAVGFVAGMLADADILIHAADDPLLNVELHRHFTHSLIFIPFGALIATLLLWPVLRKHLDLKHIYLYALLGYATAGLLDACTSYGTHLLWPFSEARIAWSIIAIVDPVFSLLLLVALILSLKFCQPMPARVGLAMAGTYLLLGLWQHQNALQVAQGIAAQRGHEVQRILVKPTLGNLLLWRAVYQSGDTFYVDAIRIGLGSERIYPGGSARKFLLTEDRSYLPADSVIFQDVERFYRLADGFVIADSAREQVLTDVRYSMLPTRVSAMWGIDLNVASSTQHAKYEVYRDRPENYREIFLAMLRGRDLPR